MKSDIFDPASIAAICAITAAINLTSWASLPFGR
jgi:hypothetical protein